MTRLRRLICLLAGLAALACGGGAAVAQPATVTFNPDTCIAVVSSAVQDAKVRDAVDALRRETERAPCQGPDITGLQAQKVFALVTAEIDQRRRDYGCAVNKTLPVCQGLEAAHRRAQSMANAKPDLPTAIKADATGALSGTDTFAWRRQQLTFGVSPSTGLSLLKLVLRSGPARGSELEKSVTPETTWLGFAPRLAAAPEAGLACDEFCAASTGQVVALFPLFRALQFAIEPAQGVVLAEDAANLEAKRQRWDAYHFGGGDLRVQLPWELAINGVIFNQNRPKGPDGHYAPFPPPPNWALTVLHPSVGLALKDTKGADSSLVGVVEVLGFSTWRYSDENKREREWGLSAIAVYQPRDNDRDWGYGVLARLPWKGLNVAWTHTDLKGGKDANQLLLSIDVSKYIGGGTGDIARIFQLKDPGK